MQIKVNFDVREIKDEIAFGFSGRQLFWGVIALVLGVLSYTWAQKTFGSDELAAALMLVAVAVPGAIGFLKWHKMPAERVVLYVLHTLFSPKRVVFKGENLCAPEIKIQIAAHREKERRKAIAEKKESKKRK